MKKRYEQVMEKVEVTDEMKKRILNQIRNTDFEPPALGSPAPEVLQWKRKKQVPYKKYLRTAACLVILFIGASVMPGLIGRMGVVPGPAEPYKPTGSQVQAVPDIQEYSSLAELSSAVGFSVVEPKNLPFEPEETVYLVFWKELAQIRYSRAGMTATFRMSAGTEDTSGDFNSYATVTEYRIGEDIPRENVTGEDAREEELTEETVVTLKGNSGGYSLALWTDGNFFYSIKMSDEQPDEVFLNMISGIKEEK